jgi:prevent-host-death family protein
MPKNGINILPMKRVSIREMKANWSEIERQVQQGGTFEVLRRGKPSVRIVPVAPRQVLKWDDHLVTAAKVEGYKGSEVVYRNGTGAGDL